MAQVYARLVVVLLVMVLACVEAHAGGRETGGRSAPSLPDSGFEVGQIFPGIVLPSARDGRPLSLAKFRGKKTILHIFASW